MLVSINWKFEVMIDVFDFVDLIFNAIICLVFIVSYVWLLAIAALFDPLNLLLLCYYLCIRRNSFTLSYLQARSLSKD